MSGGGVCHALVCRQSRDVLWPEADSMSQLGVSQPASILPVSRHGGSVSSVRCTCATLLPASSRSRRVSLCVAVASQVLLSTAMEHWTRVRHLQQQRQEVRQAIEAAKDAVSRSFVGIASQQAASKVRCGPLSRPPTPTHACAVAAVALLRPPSMLLFQWFTCCRCVGVLASMAMAWSSSVDQGAEVVEARRRVEALRRRVAEQRVRLDAGSCCRDHGRDASVSSLCLYPFFIDVWLRYLYPRHCLLSIPPADVSLSTDICCCC
jgi:hypothetical protein